MRKSEKQKITNERWRVRERQREIRDEIDLQRMSGAIMRQQLNDLTVDDQAVPTRASSVVSGLSRVSRISSHPSIPNNSTFLAQTPAAFTQTSTMTTTAPITRIMATPQPQPSTVVISTVAQTLPMTTPLVGSAARIPTPTRLFGQPAATMPSTPKNASVTTSITNPTFSTPSSTSVTAQPVMTSQPTSTVYNIVTPPTSVSQVPVSIIPPTTTPVTAPISTSAVPQAPATTVPPFVQPTSTSVAAPVSSSAAYPFTPATTATIYAPTTSNMTHVPVSVPLPSRSSASVPFPPGSSASVPFPPGSSASTSSWFSSWRNTGQPNFFGPTPPTQPPSVPPAQPPSVPPTQPPSFTPASSTSHAWPPNPPPTTSIQMSTVPTSSIPTSTTQVTSAPPYSTSHVPVSLGPSYGPGLSAYNPIASSSPFGMGSIYGPAITAAFPTSSSFTPLTSFGHVPTSFPSISAPPFVPTNLTFTSGFPGPSAPPPMTDNPHGVYTPDAWIHNLGTAHAVPGRSSIKPPRMKAPSFDGDPRNWPMFIQMFKVFVHDAVSSDAERIAHLHDALTPSIRKDIEKQQTAKQKLVQYLTSAPLLSHFNEKLDVVIQTDASNLGLGAVLLQDDGAGPRPVAFVNTQTPTPQPPTREQPDSAQMERISSPSPPCYHPPQHFQNMYAPPIMLQSEGEYYAQREVLIQQYLRDSLDSYYKYEFQALKLKRARDVLANCKY
ncbi:hypothetical protein DAPPUDRAFT_268502 [Daphnia pulex]|uniref:Reverse transcriptase/retrotransposon-derived protein RNase H-like domain-containing protein n=1 Tax=Daphnia pulex TaxID=6669 RepID=E9HXW8_DAPPU|nr:hypothetical protein DAPPUDRAFT_268502 [Daphnia pulex]|eukprot:EFX63414.1 hypothetical protein DAPPUDRAFT_268502 [Daphnia pulex]